MSADVVADLEKRVDDLVAERNAIEQDIRALRRAIRILQGVGMGGPVGRPRGTGEMQRKIMAFAADRESFTTGEVAQAIGHTHQSTAHCLGNLANRGELRRIRRGVYGAAEMTSEPRLTR